MTDDTVRQLAQSDPVPALTKRWGEVTRGARNRVVNLEDSLRELAKITEQLAAHDLVVATDLGPTGNAARAAFQAAVADARSEHFSMPDNRRLAQTAS